MTNNPRTASASVGSGPLTLLGVAFVILKLTDVIAWSWVWVLAPFWIPLAFSLAILLLVAFAFAFGTRR